MVVLANPPTLENISFVQKQTPFFSSAIIPVVDLSQPGAAAAIVEACEEFGFFKVINHDVPIELMERLEAEAVKFFSMPESEKEKFGPANPFGYGNKFIGTSGDIGWVEYLLFAVSSNSSTTLLTDPSASSLGSALDDYLEATRKLGGGVLELMGEGLKISDALSKLAMREKSDRIFRVNHYPPFPAVQGFNHYLTGFGEHTDPQILSILRSNNSSGFEICLKDGSWVSVPPDQESFFMNVGDSLQVLTNGRFKSVKHRVLANGIKPRVSMIYFLGPQAEEKIAPLAELMEEGEQSLYKEFTWGEYKKAAFKSRLADHRLALFEK